MAADRCLIRALSLARPRAEGAVFALIVGIPASPNTGHKGHESDLLHPFPHLRQHPCHVRGQAQQTTGTPGSPDATTTIDGR